MEGDDLEDYDDFSEDRSKDSPLVVIMEEQLERRLA